MKKSCKMLPLWVILLLFAMLLSSCTGKTKDSGTDADSAVGSDDRTSSETQEPKPEEDPYQPSTDLTSLDFHDQTIRILQCEYKASELHAETDKTADILESAVYTRNDQVQKDLNVTFEFLTVQNNSGRYEPLKNAVTQSVFGASGESETYHIVANPAYYVSRFITEGLYADLGSVDGYVNLDKQYWSQSFVEASILNQKYYFLVGELCTSVLDGLEVAFVNNTLASAFFEDQFKNLYDTVYNGKWTYELMLNLAKTAGNGESTQTWGMALPCNSWSIDGLLMGFELDLLERYENGIPYVNVNTPHNVEIVESLRELYYDSPFVTTNNAEKIFNAGNAIFTVSKMSTAANYYNAGVDYSIIPVPKWNSAQENYVTITHDEYTALSLCSNLSTDDQITMTAVLEDMCYRSHKTTYPAVYEKIYQLRYTDNPENAEMFDYITQRLTFTVGYIYSAVLGEPKNEPRYLLYNESIRPTQSNRTWPIASTLSKLGGTVSQELEKFLGYIYKN